MDGDRRRLEAFEMWIWRRMERISCEIIGINEDMQILNSISQRKQRWIGHILRQDGLLYGVIDGNMRGKPNV